MHYAKYERLLKQTMGLDAASIGSSSIARAVRQRASACQLDEADAYWELVRDSATELQALIEAVVVPETWFFRDREAFAALARLAREDWLPSNPHGCLRLLSLPCSSGEEPYSMSIALLDTGFPAGRFRIDAVDISAAALARARQAVYGKNSFRGVERGFRERHFEAAGDAWRLSDAVRGQVHFQQRNLLAADFLPGTAIYDMIFCRNLLIYFDRATQDRAIGVLQRLLARKGVVFVAPCETGLMLDHDFVSANVAQAFAFRKFAGRSPATPTARAPPSTAQQPRARRGIVSASSIPARTPENPAGPQAGASRTATAAEPAARPDLEMHEASRLADQGHLGEASNCCAEHLRKHGPSAQAFHLLGLIRAAAGNATEARQYYRKALYLDQNHHATLVHLALLLEQQGDPASALVLRNRGLRLPQDSAK